MSPANADADTALLVEILQGAPEDGLSLDEIQVEVGKRGDSMSLRTINNLLCGLGFSRVKHAKVKTKLGKVTKYLLKG